MSIEAIQVIGQGEAPDLLPVHPPSPGGSFASMLVSGVTHVDDALKAADSAVARFTLDGNAPPHQVMLALEEARLELQFALQVRSRLVEGYQELMRMQI